MVLFGTNRHPTSTTEVPTPPPTTPTTTHRRHKNSRLHSRHLKPSHEPNQVITLGPCKPKRQKHKHGRKKHPNTPAASKMPILTYSLESFRYEYPIVKINISEANANVEPKVSPEPKTNPQPKAYPRPKANPYPEDNYHKLDRANSLRPKAKPTRDPEPRWPDVPGKD